MKQYDTAPHYRAYLTETINGVESPVDLTGCTVVFCMYNALTRAIKVYSPMIVENAAQGLVRYEWITTDTNTIGHFFIHVKVTDGTGDVRTFPAHGADSIDIEYCPAP